MLAKIKTQIAVAVSSSIDLIIVSTIVYHYLEEWIGSNPFIFQL